MRAWFKFAKRRGPSPGAQGYALVDFRTTTDSLVGPATMRIQGLRATQPQQSPQGLNVPIVGYGGPIAGQIVGQPLFDLGEDGMPTTQAFEG